MSGPYQYNQHGQHGQHGGGYYDGQQGYYPPPQGQYGYPPQQGYHQPGVSRSFGFRIYPFWSCVQNTDSNPSSTLTPNRTILHTPALLLTTNMATRLPMPDIRRVDLLEITMDMARR